MRRAGILPPLAAMSALLLLAAASCKTAAKAFFALPALDFITSNSLLSSDTPVGSVLAEQTTDEAYAALRLTESFAGDLMILAVIAPLAAGLLLCVLRAVRETELPDFGIRRGMSPFSAGGLGRFFASAGDYRRAVALISSMTLRTAISFAFIAAPLWAVAESDELLAPAAAYLPRGFPLLPLACALSAAFAVLGLCVFSRRFAVAALYVGDSTLSLRGAAKRSAALMRGHKIEAAALTLSFTGWWIAGFLTLGIALAFFALPYYLCCYASLMHRIGV
jgi:hypothetical protein